LSIWIYPSYSIFFYFSLFKNFNFSIFYLQLDEPKLYEASQQNLNSQRFELLLIIIFKNL